MPGLSVHAASLTGSSASRTVSRSGAGPRSAEDSTAPSSARPASTSSEMRNPWARPTVPPATRLRAVHEKVDDAFFAPLSADERKTLHALLLRLAARHDPRYAANGR